ncbi:9-O-acetyl-N-acetylneuraminate esterase, partial [Candidatus Magnetomorum sp. HK-1]
DYENDYHTGMDIKSMAKKIREYTSGYPYLVSKLCYIIDEKLKRNFSENSLEQATRIILNENNTLFDDLIKNITRFPKLYNILERIAIEGSEITYNSDAHNLGIMYGILNKNLKYKLIIHNKIFELRLYNYFIAKQEIEQGSALTYKYEAQFIDDSGDLDMELILMKFQELMKAEYRNTDERFIEREGRLLFLAFLKPIINGEGFYFVEPETRKSNRMDIVVTFNQKKFVIELKIWRGEKYAQEGREQLCNYLEFQILDKGYMVFFNFNKNKKYEFVNLKVNNKEIFEITV